jgi:hypothetical protein
LLLEDQKIAAFGSSYTHSYVGAAEGCDLLTLIFYCISRHVRYTRKSNSTW